MYSNSNRKMIIVMIIIIIIITQRGSVSPVMTHQSFKEGELLRTQVSSVTSRLLLCLPPLTSCPLSLFPPCLLYIDQLVVGGGTGAGGDHAVKRRPACGSALSPSLSFIEPGRETRVGRTDGRTETNGQELPSLSLQHSIAGRRSSGMFSARRVQQLFPLSPADN